MSWGASMKYMSGNLSLGTMIAKYDDSSIQIRDMWLLLGLMPTNGFGFKGLGNSYWAYGCSSFYLFPFSGSVWAGIRGILKLFWMPTH